jgi:hypothetical protein
MKASELRIGNLVKKGNDLCTVKGYYDNLFIVEDNEKIEFKSNVFDNIKPIPLTEEWLLKFGFLIEENGDVDFSFDFINYGLSKFEIDQKYYLHIDGNFDRTETDTRIEYVHSLQNLFFALTGEELTISNAN